MAPFGPEPEHFSMHCPRVLAALLEPSSASAECWGGESRSASTRTPVVRAKQSAERRGVGLMARKDCTLCIECRSKSASVFLDQLLFL